jgi:hypothetical protein
MKETHILQKQEEQHSTLSSLGISGGGSHDEGDGISHFGRSQVMSWRSPVYTPIIERVNRREERSISEGSSSKDSLDEFLTSDHDFESEENKIFEDDKHEYSSSKSPPDSFQQEKIGNKGECENDQCDWNEDEESEERVLDSPSDLGPPETPPPSSKGSDDQVFMKVVTSTQGVFDFSSNYLFVFDQTSYFKRTFGFHVRKYFYKQKTYFSLKSLTELFRSESSSLSICSDSSPENYPFPSPFFDYLKKTSLQTNFFFYSPFTFSFEWDVLVGIINPLFTVIRAFFLFKPLTIIKLPRSLIKLFFLQGLCTQHLPYFLSPLSLLLLLAMSSSSLAVLFEWADVPLYLLSPAVRKIRVWSLPLMLPKEVLLSNLSLEKSRESMSFARVDVLSKVSLKWVNLLQLIPPPQLAEELRSIQTYFGEDSRKIKVEDEVRELLEGQLEEERKHFWKSFSLRGCSLIAPTMKERTHYLSYVSTPLGKLLTKKYVQTLPHCKQVVSIPQTVEIKQLLSHSHLDEETKCCCNCNGLLLHFLSLLPFSPPTHMFAIITEFFDIFSLIPLPMLSGVVTILLSFCQILGLPLCKVLGISHHLNEFTEEDVRKLFHVGKFPILILFCVVSLTQLTMNLGNLRPTELNPKEFLSSECSSYAICSIPLPLPLSLFKPEVLHSPESFPHSTASLRSIHPMYQMWQSFLGNVKKLNGCVNDLKVLFSIPDGNVSDRFWKLFHVLLSTECLSILPESDPLITSFHPYSFDDSESMDEDEFLLQSPLEMESPSEDGKHGVVDSKECNSEEGDGKKRSIAVDEEKGNDKYDDGADEIEEGRNENEDESKTSVSEIEDITSYNVKEMKQKCEDTNLEGRASDDTDLTEQCKKKREKAEGLKARRGHHKKGKEEEREDEDDEYERDDGHENKEPP